MLVDFSVKNFGPFRDRHTFSMQATGVGGHPEMVIGEDSVRKGLLSSSFVFGANASGKSHLVKALTALKDLMFDTNETGSGNRCYEPFRRSEESVESPTELNIRLLIDSVLYDYSISYDRDSIRGESLYVYPNGRRACVFDRAGPEGFRKSKRSIEKLTSPGSPYLVVASQVNDCACIATRQAILDVITVSGSNDLLAKSSCRVASEDAGIKEGMICGLRLVGLDISDMIYEERDCLNGEPVILFEHDAGNGDGRFVTSLDEESAGTRCLVGLVAPLFEALSGGKTIAVDEFGSN